jgi:hypothetical protein
MARRITYREISIAFGVIVAVIILIVIWLNPFEAAWPGTGMNNPPKSAISTGSILLQKIVTTLQDSFR